MKSNNKSVLIVHPHFKYLGGAELLSLYIVKYFIDNNYNVSLLTLETPDYHILKKQSVLTLNRDKINIINYNLPNFLKNKIHSLTLLKLALLNRYAKKLSENFDICISTYNEMDFGKQCIQYIHHPILAGIDILDHYNLIPRNHFFRKYKFIYYLYNLFIRIIGQYSTYRISRNITIVNSFFIKRIVDNIYHTNSIVLYPGFIQSKNILNAEEWDKRKFRFVTIGRISPDKDYEKGILIINELIKHFDRIEFIIIGHMYDENYFKKLISIVKKYNLPVIFLHDIEKENILNILKETRYYLHFKEYEHFGISILEAIDQGCIPFVHDSGGQTEIVSNELLRYKNSVDLCNKIKLMESNLESRKQVLLSLNETKEKFNTSQFEKNFDKIIRESLIV